MPEQQQSATERLQQYEKQQQTIEQRAEHIDHILLIMSGKGGVGKSTVAANLASTLARQGSRVGLLDADLHGPNVPAMTGTDGMSPSMADGLLEPVTAEDGLKVISMGMLLENPDSPTIWRGPLRASAIRQLIADVNWGDLDYLFVDLPPGTGDEPLTVAQAFPNADGVIIVSTPQRVSQDDCRKAINFAGAVKLSVVGVIENMSGFVCPHCGKETPIFSSGGGEQMATQMQVPFLGRLPLVPEVVGLCDSGQSLTGPQAPAAIRDAFNSVVEALTARS